MLKYLEVSTRCHENSKEGKAHRSGQTLIILFHGHHLIIIFLPQTEDTASNIPHLQFIVKFVGFLLLEALSETFKNYD